MPSLLLRGISLGAKFVLLVVMARYLPMDDIGRYGLAVATVSILSRLAGAEFYTVTSRELVTAEPAARWRVVNGQASVVLVGLLLATPASWAVTLFFDLGVTWWMLALLLAMHQVGMETTRILIAVGHPFRSYLVSALVNGVWPLALVSFWLAAPSTATLDSVWWAWLSGGAVGALVGVALLVWSLEARWHWGTPGWEWMRGGFRTAALFLVGAGAFRAIEFADRFIVELFLGTAAVGVYTYYASFAKLVIELPTVLVVAPRFPEVMAAMRRGTAEVARRALAAFTRRCIALAGLSVPPLFVGLWAVTRLLDRPSIWAEPVAYILLLTAGVLLAGSQGDHHALYGAGRDGALAAITVAAALANVLLGLALTPFWGMGGAAFGTLAAMAMMLGLKSALGRRAVAALPSMVGNATSGSDDAVGSLTAAPPSPGAMP